MDKASWIDIFQGANGGGWNRGKGGKINNLQEPIVLHGSFTWEGNQIRLIR